MPTVVTLLLLYMITLLLHCNVCVVCPLTILDYSIVTLCANYILYSSNTLLLLHCVPRYDTIEKRMLHFQLFKEF